MTPAVTATAPARGARALGPHASLDARAISTIRFLAADMVEEARSGHPGMPMGAAPMAWALWSRHLRHDPTDPAWPDRDRFVLSAGHGSALQYALLHLFGYDVPLAELRRFRQLGSRTPGHPEFGHTPGVEATTGPLGQGIAMAVGMALAERMQAARFPLITGHHTYAIVGDGCLMEGISHEAGSLAGQLRLGRLTVLWDDNDVTIDGPATQSCGDDQLARFAAYGWQVARVTDGTDVDAIDAAIARAKADPRPSLIAVRTTIGHGAPGIAGTSAAHGAPLGPETLAAAKAAAGWPVEGFVVPDDVAAYCHDLATRRTSEHARWSEHLDAFAAASPRRAAEWRRTWERRLPPELPATLASAVSGSDLATRQSSRAVLAAASASLPELVGGSADLAGSTGVGIGAAVTADDHSGTDLRFGIREHAMGAVLNGLSLHGGFRAYGSTFLVFADYLRPALRLSALMGQPVIHVLTHDSVAVGEDGPTHQPVEHLESLRVIPGLTVLRPADDHEVAWAWQQALENVAGPTALILSRQGLPSLSCSDADRESLTRRGFRVVLAQAAPDVELVATGSEVGLALAAARELADLGLAARVLSVPCRERWAAHRPTVGVPRLSVEAGVTSGWRGLVDATVGVDGYGASGPGAQVLAHVGLTPAAVAAAALALVQGTRQDEGRDDSC